MNLKIEAKDETGLFEDATYTRFETVEAAVAWIDDFYGEGYTGTQIHVLDIENALVVWANYNQEWEK